MKRMRNIYDSYIRDKSMLREKGLFPSMTIGLGHLSDNWPFYAVAVHGAASNKVK